MSSRVKVLKVKVTRYTLVVVVNKTVSRKKRNIPNLVIQNRTSRVKESKLEGSDQVILIFF